MQENKFLTFCTQNSKSKPYLTLGGFPIEIETQTMYIYIISYLIWVPILIGNPPVVLECTTFFDNLKSYLMKVMTCIVLNNAINCIEMKVV